MTDPKSLVAYIRVIVRRRLSSKDLLKHPDFKRQAAAIMQFAKSQKRPIITTYAGQTTYGKSPFVHEEKFHAAITESERINADVVVADLLHLLKHVDASIAIAELNKIPKNLYSIVHRGKPTPEAVYDCWTQKAVKRRKKNKPGSEQPHVRPGGSVRGLRSWKMKSDRRIENLAPVLQAIVKSTGSSSVKIAKALNEQQIPTARGKKWYPASARRICRKLKLLPD